MVHLEIGEPDLPTPANICEAAKAALDCGQTHYCDSQGVLELREAIAEKVEAMRGVSVDPGTVVITPGLRPILFYGALLALSEGDDGIYFDPAFAAFPSVINFAGGRAVPVPLRSENGFRLDIEDLRAAITPRTRLLTLNWPHNPTGCVLTAADYEAIAEVAEEYDLIVVSDETYEEIYYGETPPSAIQFPSLRARTIVMSGFSKTYRMTGWRLGYAVVPPKLVDGFVRLTANSVTCSTTFVQHAAVAALRGPQDSIIDMVREFRRRRDMLVDGLNAIPGVECHSPEGAFYAFPRVSGLGIEDMELADRLLDEAGVATLGGSVFGEQGRGHIRLAYTTSYEAIELGLARITDFVNSLETATPRSG